MTIVQKKSIIKSSSLVCFSFSQTIQTSVLLFSLYHFGCKSVIICPTRDDNTYNPPSNSPLILTDECDDFPILDMIISRLCRSKRLYLCIVGLYLLLILVIVYVSLFFNASLTGHFCTQCL